MFPSFQTHWHLRDAVADLLSILQRNRLKTGSIVGCLLDSVVWRPSVQNSFSVTSCYAAICNRYSKYGPPNRFGFVIPLIWKAEVPLKVKAFGWRCFKYRLPTKDLLSNRGIFPPSSNLFCFFCENIVESSIHSLLLWCKADFGKNWQIGLVCRITKSWILKKVFGDGVLFVIIKKLEEVRWSVFGWL